jgi:hypothetical protein
MAGYYIGDDGSPYAYDDNGQAYEIGAGLTPEETGILIRAISSGIEDGIQADELGRGAGVGMYEIGQSYEIGAPMLKAAPAPTGARPKGVPFRPMLSAGRGQPMMSPRMPLNTMPKAPPMGSNPMLVNQVNPQNARVLYLGFDSVTDVPAGSTVNVSTNTQDVFKPRKIIISATIAPLFVINDIKVGNISQFSSSAAVPAEAFVANSVSADVNFDTAQVSQQITFNVSNVSGAPARFRAAINGFVARL